MNNKKDHINPRYRSKRKRVVFEETGEHRPLRAGEWYKDHDGIFHQAREDGVMWESDVYTRREE